MTDKDIIQEIEANERRAGDDGRDAGDDGPGNLITDAIGTLLHPLEGDRPNEDEEAERRVENDALQRPD